MAAKTEIHRQQAEVMRQARAKASAHTMSRAEFLAQTPKELHYKAKTTKTGKRESGRS